jgi:integrase
MRDAGWQHVDWEAGLLRLPHSKTTKVTGRGRLIPLPDDVLRLLRWLHRGRGYPREGHIFLNSRGRRWTCTAFATLFRKLARQAGVRPGVSPYCLRHGFCVESLEAGVGERQIADAMGHTTTRQVAWYGKDTRGNADYLRGVVENLRRHRADRQKGGAA